MDTFESLEICAGAGGQAIGLERAGFEHAALVEIGAKACQTLRHNRPAWNVICKDVREFSAHEFQGVDLLSGGVPCPPFSIAGQQLGKNDERDMFPEAIRLAKECHPKAVMLENVRGLMGNKFAEYRDHIEASFEKIGLTGQWKLLNASDYGVPQLRPRAIFVALRKEFLDFFQWPSPNEEAAPTVALIQGFPADWDFPHKKTAAFRKVGNAFPPPVAEAMGKSIRAALSKQGKGFGKQA